MLEIRRRRKETWKYAKGLTPLKTIAQPDKINISLRGFTLVEVLVSLVIISITAVGIFASFIAAQHYIERSGRRIVAFNFARQQFEQLKPAVSEATWANNPTCDPNTNGLANTTNCADGWTSWKNLTGDFETTWNGQLRYNVTAGGSSGDYRVVRTEVKWRAAD